MTGPDAADDTRSPDEPGRRRDRRSNQVPLIVAFVVALLAIPTVIALVLTSSDGGSHTYVIPAGTGARIAAGQKVEVMPSEIELKVGEHLVIRNQDSEPYVIGPLAVRANETLDHQFDTPGTYIGQCALGSEDVLRIIVT